jgi:hypothetical protein
VAIIWAATNGYLDDVEPEKVGEFETGFYRFLESTHADLLPAIESEKALSNELTEQLETAVKAYRDQSGFGKEESDEAKAQDKKEAEAREDVAEQDLKDSVKTMGGGAS